MSISVEDSGRYCSDKDSLRLLLKRSLLLLSQDPQVSSRMSKLGFGSLRKWILEDLLTLAEEVSMRSSEKPPKIEGRWYDSVKRKVEEEKGREPPKTHYML